jgi:hypothetical protein
MLRGSILGDIRREGDRQNWQGIGKEGRSVYHPPGSCFRSPSYGFGKKTGGIFF